MKYLVATDRKAAEDRSQAAWDALRPSKQPGDVTKYLWPIQASTKDGSFLVVVNDKEALLTPAEASKAVSVVPADYVALEPVAVKDATGK